MLSPRIAMLMACSICMICVLGAVGDVGDDCAQTTIKYGVPGDYFTLTGPTATGGATYSYFWTVVDSSNSPITFTPNPQNKSISFTIPTTSEVFASVLVTDTRTGGCALKSCVDLKINTTNTCSLINTTAFGTQICVTKTDPQTYEYTGTADLSNHKTAYLNWLVDGDLKLSKDTAGQFTFVWSNPTYNTVGDHTVTIEVRSAKNNQLLSTCSLTVRLLKEPDTTITQT
jgi:hypothetical protein